MTELDDVFKMNCPKVTINGVVVKNGHQVEALGYKVLNSCMFKNDGVIDNRDLCFACNFDGKTFREDNNLTVEYHTKKVKYPDTDFPDKEHEEVYWIEFKTK